MDIISYALFKKQMGGKADLVNGKIPESQLPSYVDDAVEFDSLSEFPENGEEGKIYIAKDTGYTYRWSGSQYVQIGGQDLSDYPTKSGNETISGEWTFTDLVLGANSGFELENGSWFQGNLKIDGSIIPYVTNDVDLGSPSYTWKDLYLGGKVYFGNGAYVDCVSSAIQFHISTTLICDIYATDTYWRTNFTPATNNAVNLGSNNNQWKDLFVAGNIGNGTQAYTVYESYGAMFNPTTTGTTVIKWSQLLTFSLSADTTFTFETAKSGCLNEYKAIITNSHQTNAITLTFTGVTSILCNDDNCVVNANTITIPSGVTIEVSVINGKMCAINFNA